MFVQCFIISLAETTLLFLPVASQFITVLGQFQVNRQLLVDELMQGDEQYFFPHLIDNADNLFVTMCDQAKPL